MIYLFILKFLQSADGHYLCLACVCLVLKDTKEISLKRWFSYHCFEWSDICPKILLGILHHFNTKNNKKKEQKNISGRAMYMCIIYGLQQLGIGFKGNLQAQEKCKW